jgi:hypothetical protein
MLSRVLPVIFSSSLVLFFPSEFPIISEQVFPEDKHSLLSVLGKLTGSHLVGFLFSHYKPWRKAHAVLLMSSMQIRSCHRNPWHGHLLCVCEGFPHLKHYSAAEFFLPWYYRPCLYYRCSCKRFT